MIRLPLNQQIGIREVSAHRQKMEQVLERDPTTDELAEALGKKEEQISDYIKSNLGTRSYDDFASSQETEPKTFLEFMASEDENLINAVIMDESRQHQIKALFSVLSKREQQVLYMAFGLFNHPIMNNDDIARRMGLTKERIRQLIKYSLGKLRKMAKPGYLQDYA